jgi:glycopeptide antibiotics resistance protein
MVEGVARIHDKLLQINDSSALFLTDKQLHFAVMGLLGMGLLLVIYPLFLLLSKRHVLTIAWIYVFTVMVMLSFAIEIGQGITDTGNMDLEDVISGLAGFMLLFIIFAILRMIFVGIRNLLFPESR